MYYLAVEERQRAASDFEYFMKYGGHDYRNVNYGEGLIYSLK